MNRTRKDKELSNTVLHCCLLLAINVREPTCPTTVWAKGDYLALKIRRETLFLILFSLSSTEDSPVKTISC